MNNNQIETTNKILLESMVAYNNGRFDTLLTINEKHILLQRKKGLFKKKYKVIKDIPINTIKVINDKVKIEQKKNKITIYTTDEKVNFKCSNFIESKKIVEEINKQILGENFLERVSKKSVKTLKTIKKTAKIIGGVALAGVSAYTAVKENKDKIIDAAKTIVDVVKK